MDDPKKRTASSNRRRFLQAAAGAGLTLGGAARTAAFGQSTGEDGKVRVGLIGTEGRVSLITASGGPRELELPEPVDFFADFMAELAGEGEHLISQERAATGEDRSPEIEEIW